MLLAMALVLFAAVYLYFGLSASLKHDKVVKKASEEGDGMFPQGFVDNLNEFGYDVVDENGKILRHVTTGPVMCDLGVCDHENHRQ